MEKPTNLLFVSITLIYEHFSILRNIFEQLEGKCFKVYQIGILVSFLIEARHLYWENPH